MCKTIQAAMWISLVVYFIAYFILSKNIFIFCAMTGGKHAPEGKSKPSPKLTAIELEMKLRMICKYYIFLFMCMWFKVDNGWWVGGQIQNM